MRFTFRVLAAVAAVALSIGAANAAPIVIDNFSSFTPGATGPSGIQNSALPNAYSNWSRPFGSFGQRGFVRDSSNGFTPPPATAMTITETGLTGVLGGGRQTTLTVTSIGTDGLGIAGVISTTGTGTLNYTAGDTADGSLTLSYSTLTPTNLSSMAGLALDFLNLEASGTASVTVTISDGVNSWSSVLNPIPASTGPFTLLFPFANFTGPGAPNTANITSITFLIDGAVAQDYGLDQVYAYQVPEPMSLTVFGVLAVGGVAAVARRKLLARKSVASAA